MKPRLQVAAGPLADSIYFLTDAEVRIGRDPSNSLAISDLSLSRRHCLLSREQDSYKICDLDSRNGTFVNGGAVSEKRLNHGDQISVGESVFVFLDKDEDPDETIAAGGGVRRLPHPGHHSDSPAGCSLSSTGT